MPDDNLPAAAPVVQWWLARLDGHGNPTLCDGAHSDRAGAEQAYFIIKSLGLNKTGSRYAVARVELSPATGTADGVNMDAIATLQSAGMKPEGGA